MIDNEPIKRLVYECMSICNHSIVECSTEDLATSSPRDTFSAILAPSRIVDQSALLRRLSSHAPVIIVDERPTVRKAVDAIRNGAHDYIPVGTQQELSDAILHSINEFQIEGGRFTLEQEILGDCDEIRELRNLIRKVAPTDGPVLVQGATGTGKSLVAHSIHAMSNRADRPFVKLDCDRLPPDRAMRELFGNGHGEVQSGRVAASDGGTLFLNEIGNLPSEAQAALLHLLDHGEIQQFEEAQPTTVDTRLIVGSVFSLDALSELGKVGSSLCIRLSQFRLTLPSLMDRGSDVLLLAEDKLEKHSSGLGRSELGFEDSTVTRMMSYDWPGNVRELDQAVERAVLVSESDRILPADLGIDSIPPPQRENEQFSGEFTSLEDYFIEFVRSNEERFTETELAEKLGISRKSLWERRNKLGIPRQRAKVKRLHS
ncbi:MAG: sigma 54-interacting transcriptional regulator [Gammaproteobacteria bacterium]|nr:sigma 54-interacting transcriptional regulator [Gammaproteobacteria bacterium]